MDMNKDDENWLINQCKIASIKPPGDNEIDAFVERLAIMATENNMSDSILRIAAFAAMRKARNQGETTG